jgi:hypothetical protein
MSKPRRCRIERRIEEAKGLGIDRPFGDGPGFEDVVPELRALWAEHDAVTACLRAVDEESGQAVALLALRRAHEESHR